MWRICFFNADCIQQRSIETDPFLNSRVGRHQRRRQNWCRLGWISEHTKKSFFFSAVCSISAKRHQINFRRIVRENDRKKKLLSPDALFTGTACSTWAKRTAQKPKITSIFAHDRDLKLNFSDAPWFTIVHAAAVEPKFVSAISVFTFRTTTIIVVRSCNTISSSDSQSKATCIVVTMNFIIFSWLPRRRRIRILIRYYILFCALHTRTPPMHNTYARSELEIVDPLSSNVF